MFEIQHAVEQVDDVVSELSHETAVLRRALPAVQTKVLMVRRSRTCEQMVDPSVDGRKRIGAACPLFTCATRLVSNQNSARSLSLTAMSSPTRYTIQYLGAHKDESRKTDGRYSQGVGVGNIIGLHNHKNRCIEMYTAPPPTLHAINDALPTYGGLGLMAFEDEGRPVLKPGQNGSKKHPFHFPFKDLKYFQQVCCCLQRNGRECGCKTVVSVGPN